MPHNVPFIGPKSRYSVLSVNSGWVVHKMNIGVNFNGVLPEDGSGPADPAISAGFAKWSSLTSGGLFDWLDRRHSIVVEEFYEIPAGATITKKIVRVDGRLDNLPSVPFKLGPREVIKITSTGATGTSEVGVLARIEGSEIL